MCRKFLSRSGESISGNGEPGLRSTIIVTAGVYRGPLFRFADLVIGKLNESEKLDTQIQIVVWAGCWCYPAAVRNVEDPVFFPLEVHMFIQTHRLGNTN